MDQYKEIYLRLSSAVEKWIIRAICVLLSLLLIAQCLLRFPEIRRMVNKVDKLEGQPYLYKIKELDKSGEPQQKE